MITLLAIRSVLGQSELYSYLESESLKRLVETASLAVRTIFNPSPKHPVRL